MSKEHPSFPLAPIKRSALTEQQLKNQAAIALLSEWLEDTSGYDEKVWPVLKQTIEENRLSDRRRFDD